MPVAPFIPAIIGGVAAVASGVAANKSAESEGKRIDALERERFAQAKIEADTLRQRGDEAAAVAIEEGVLAELGAENYETFSNEYADSAEKFATTRQTKGADYAKKAQDFAARNEGLAYDLYERIGVAADERQATGEAGAGRITSTANQGVNSLRNATSQGVESLRGAAGNVTAQAERASAGQTDAFGNIDERYSPFLNSERQAVGQLGAELGLSPGEQYKGYRDSPAYQAAMDASTGAQEATMEDIRQEGANAGSLYSGRRIQEGADRANRGNYERAGIEQSYYQNYMNMLQQQANPNAAGAVSGFEAQTARDVGQNYMNAAQAGLSAEGRALSATQGAETTALNAQMGAQANAEQLRQASLRTGGEGAFLRDMRQTGLEGAGVELATGRTGTEGYEIAATGFDRGTAGSPYRMGAAGTQLDTQLQAGGLITGNMPNGQPGANLRMQGVAAQNAAIADIVGGVAQGYSSYLGRPSANTSGYTKQQIIDNQMY